MIQSSKSKQNKFCTQEDQNELHKYIPEKPGKMLKKVRMLE